MLILASASPRRVELLRGAGFEFEVLPAEIDEDALIGKDPWITAETIALEKARAVQQLRSDATILGGDTVVAIGDGNGWTLLGKPTDDADAVRMLGILNGREHVVVTGVAVVIGDDDRRTTEWVLSETSRVRIEMTPPEIAAYVGSGEPRGKAGAYAIQGGHPGITLVSGPLDNVIGFPMDLVKRMVHTSKTDVE